MGVWNTDLPISIHTFADLFQEVPLSTPGATPTNQREIRGRGIPLGVSDGCGIC